MNSTEDRVVESLNSWISHTPVLQEGKIWNGIKKWFANPGPNDPERNSLWRQYKKGFEHCKKMYPDTDIKIDLPIGDKQYNFEYYKKNKKGVICILHVEVKWFGALVKMYEKRGVESMCENHKYPDKCMAYLNRDFRNVKTWYMNAKADLEMIDKTERNPRKEVTKAQWNKLMKNFRK